MSMRDRVAGAASAWKVVSLVVLLALFAFGLRLVDHLPGFLFELPRSVRQHPTVADAERAIGRPVTLPAYFPSTLRWPAATVRTTREPPYAAAAVFSGADGRPGRLAICDANVQLDACDTLLLPPVTVLARRPIELAGHRAELRRVLEPQGRLLHEVRWRGRDRARVVRFDGGVDQLLLIAQSTLRSGQ